MGVVIAVAVSICVGVAMGLGAGTVAALVGAEVAGEVGMAVLDDATTVAVAPGDVQLATVTARKPSRARAAMTENCRRRHVLPITFFLPLLCNFEANQQSTPVWIGMSCSTVTILHADRYWFETVPIEPINKMLPSSMHPLQECSTRGNFSADRWKNLLTCCGAYYPESGENS